MNSNLNKIFQVIAFGFLAMGFFCPAAEGKADFPLAVPDASVCAAHSENRPFSFLDSAADNGESENENDSRDENESCNEEISFLSVFSFEQISRDQRGINCYDRLQIWDLPQPVLSPPPEK